MIAWWWLLAIPVLAYGAFVLLFWVRLPLVVAARTDQELYDSNELVFTGKDFMLMEPHTIREFNCASQFDGSSDDALRREYHLSRRGIFEIARDWFRGYADVDILSFDAKANRLMPDDAFTPAEHRAVTMRRRKWTNTY